MLLRDMLADLWSRNAILQCSHNRESLTFVGALYFGSVDDDAVFDPTRLAPLSAQIKLKIKPDTSAERHLRRPISIPRAGNLPHFALVMELGTEALHENGSNVKTTISSPVSDEEFYGCEKTLRDAQKRLLELKVKKAKEPDIDVQKKKVEEKQQAMNACNRYLVSIRGASPNVYSILEEAKIAHEFQNFLGMVSPLAVNSEDEIQTVMPLRQLNCDTPYTTWMRRFMMDHDSASMVVD